MQGLLSLFQQANGFVTSHRHTKSRPPRGAVGSRKHYTDFRIEWNKYIVGILKDLFKNKAVSDAAQPTFTFELLRKLLEQQKARKQDGNP